MTKFYKPGKHDKDYHDLAEIAIKRSLRDAGIEFSAVQQAYAGYVYGDSTCGQRAVYTVGTTGIPIVNVNNNCSTGSTALYLAHNAVAGRQAECVLAVGFEKMQTGSLSAKFTDRTNPLEEFVFKNLEIREGTKAPMAP
jgi:acetyl-CoA acetyltransferase